jgi:adenosylhomocysteinase
MKLMKDGAIVANSGHFDVEIDLKTLNKKAESKKRIRPFLDEYILNGKRIYIAGEGRLINLAAAEGHPSTVMSLSFCGQSLAVEYLIKNKGKLPKRVITLPKKIDEIISWLQLEAMNINIDKLTEEQKKYLASWQEGT